MNSDQLLNQDPLRQWFTLDQLLTSVLADVIQTDARFQLMQGEAWRQFAESLREFDHLPQMETLDFTVGFGRLENLGLSELDINLDLESYQPHWFKRLWWGTLHLFGFKHSAIPARYRLARSNKASANRLELGIKVRRNHAGQWEVNSEPDKSALSVA